MSPRSLATALCLALVLPAGLAIQSPAASHAGGPSALVDAFNLHSKPGSTRTIFLDFDGASVTGTVWNDQLGRAQINAPAWTIDADPTTFSAAERTVVERTWQRVAEAYSPFDVDVTTEEPGSDAITRSGPTDLEFGTRALITADPELHDQLCNCPGIAQVNAFDEANQHARYQPAWILTDGPGGDDEGLSQTVTHEVGHQLGLGHDGIGAQEYYAGAFWGPVMGLGGQGLTQWSNGDYAGSTNQQDDVQVISANGAPVRTDESDGPLPVGAAFISTRTDLDTYDLPACAGTTTVVARPAPVGPTLDIRLTLTDSQGSVLSTNDPPAHLDEQDEAGGLGAVVSSTYPGALRVTIDGAGLPGTYSDYGSLGSYTLERRCGAPLSAPGPPTTFAAALDGSGRNAVLTWRPPASDGGSPVTGYVVRAGGDVLATLPAHATTTKIRVQRGFVYRFSVFARNAVGESPAATVTLVTATAPGSPPLRSALAGKPGRPVTATARWRQPVDDGGAAVTGYLVTALRLDAAGRVVDRRTSRRLPASARTYVFPLARGRYAFTVRAVNAIGPGTASARSNAVPAR